MCSNDILISIILEIINTLICSIVGAIFLRAASQLVAKLRVPIGKAFWTVLIWYIVNRLLFIWGYFIFKFSGSVESFNLTRTVMLTFGFLSLSGIIIWRLRLSLIKACLVSITMVGIGLVIVLLAWLITFLVMQARGTW